MKRTLLSLLTVGLVSTVALGLSTAFFSDTETSSNNLLQAGAIDLKIDNTSYYNGEYSSATSWDLDDLDQHRFFDFNDLKPGDWGEDTVSIHVEDNDAWACFNITVTENDDVSCTEPELIFDPNCVEQNLDLFDGELADLLHFIFWVDDGDNVLEDNESPFAQGLASQVLPAVSGALADATGNIFNPAGGPLSGGQTYYIGKAWCFGEMTLTPVSQDGLDNPDNSPETDPGFTCDGSGLDDASQTDRLVGDISFSAVQSRHNPNFTCDGEVPEDDVCPNIDGIQTQVPDGYHIDDQGNCVPDNACIDDADVMLVLDRSGSISSTELADLKTAALDFVVALDPQSDGGHIGQSSFATSGSLDQELTDDDTLINAAINALARGGYTNLYQGLNLAAGELASVRDRDDNDSPDYYVVITDGHPNRPLPSSTADDVAAAKAAGITSGGGTIYVVGVGNDVDAAYLQSDIASAPGNYYPVTDYSALETALNDIVTQCP
ncbi:VWA domain-containing protein [Pseudomonadota bacterium]